MNFGSMPSIRILDSEMLLAGRDREEGDTPGHSAETAKKEPSDFVLAMLRLSVAGLYHSVAGGGQRAV